MRCWGRRMAPLLLMKLLIVILCIYIAIKLLDVGLFVVGTNSMAPQIPQGSIVAVAPATIVEKGDVITYRYKNNPAHLVTHRVIAVRQAGKANLYTTKGDNNYYNDAVPVSAHEVVGKVIFPIPFLGNIYELMLNPIMLILFFYIPMGYLAGKLINGID